MASPAHLTELREALAIAASGSKTGSLRVLASSAELTAESVSILGVSQATSGTVVIRFEVLAGDAHAADSSVAAASITESLQMAFVDGSLARVLASQPLLSQIISGSVTLSEVQTLAVAVATSSPGVGGGHALSKQPDKSAAFALAGLAIAAMLLMAVALWLRGRFARTQSPSRPPATARV